MAKSTVRTRATFAVILYLHAFKYLQEMHRVNGSGATMSAESVFGAKTNSASMANYSKKISVHYVAPPDRKSAKTTREYKTKFVRKHEFSYFKISFGNFRT